MPSNSKIVTENPEILRRISVLYTELTDEYSDLCLNPFELSYTFSSFIFGFNV
jgi:hypothetical protein